MELCMREKAVFFLPVNILMVRSPAFLAARHTTVCLDSSQSWYRDAPLYPPSVCQISRQSDIAFAFYSSFCKCAKRGRKIRRKKPEEIKPIFEVAYLGNA